MAICNGCGGVLGRDCFNQYDCEWISRDMERQAYAEPLRQKVEELRDTLALILPLARGYAAVHPVGSNQAYVNQAERLLQSSTDTLKE